MPTLDGCKERQRRLLEHMENAGLDGVLLSRPRTICYFTGILPDSSWPQALVFDGSGDATLITNSKPPTQIPAKVLTYTGYTLDRAFGRETAHPEAAEIVRDLICRGRTGIEAGWISASMMAALSGPAEDLSPALVEMRRRKMADEIESMRATARLAEAGYAAIKRQLEPGMTELDAYRVILDAIVTAAGTSVELNGDFACGVRAIGGGGPPTTRVIERGDLCIFDLFPTFEGYTCDLCRTFAAGEPTAEQQEVWTHVLRAHDVAREYIRSGLSTSAAYNEIKRFLDGNPLAGGTFTHHAGHGVGMDGWEQPWLNAGSDQTLVEGEVIACEPGLYSEALNGGIRLEHNYVVTQNGPVPIDSFPMDL